MRDSRSFDSLKSEYRRLIYNSYNPQIAPALASRGISEAHLNKGKALYGEVAAMFDETLDLREVKGVQYRDFGREYEVAQEALRELTTMIKLVGNQYPDQAKDMGVYAAVPGAQPEWIEFARRIYEKILERPAYVAICTARGVSQEQLQTELARVMALDELKDGAVAAKGASEWSRKERDAKWKELQVYCSDLTGWARLALKDKPQLLEILGIYVKS